MPRDIVFTSNAAKPPPAYSQAVKAGGLVFVSGTAPTDPATGEFVGATVQQQSRPCLKNVEAILLAAGTSLDKIVSVTSVLADEEDFAGMNEEYLRWFPFNPPARQGAQAARTNTGSEDIDRGNRRSLVGHGGAPVHGR